MPKEWKVSNMNARDPIRWLAHLISFSHGENRDQIHWQFLRIYRIYVVFSHSESTGCLQQKHGLATSWKERQNKREEESFRLEFHFQLQQMCSMYKFRNKEHKQKRDKKQQIYIFYH